MAVTDPYPGQPTDGQSLDAVPILAKFNALFQGIQSFDGSQIQAGTVAGSAMQTSVNPNTLLKETESPFVETGLVWSSVSGLQGTMSSGVAYIANASSMFRVSITGVGSYTFTASKDTYIDIDYNGNVTYNAVTNGATAPALTANSIRVAKVVTSGAAITSVTTFGSDGNGNIIYPVGAGSTANLQSPVEMMACLAGTQSLTGSQWNLVKPDTKIWDSGNNYNTSTGLFTCPVNGYYDFRGNTGLIGASGSLMSIGLYVNASSGAPTYNGNQGNSGSSLQMYNFSIRIQAAAGTTFGLAYYNGAATGNAANSTAPYNSWVNISLAHRT